MLPIGAEWCCEWSTNSSAELHQLEHAFCQGFASAGRADWEMVRNVAGFWHLATATPAPIGRFGDRKGWVFTIVHASAFLIFFRYPTRKKDICVKNQVFF